MELQPPDAPLPGLFEPLRRRHPDVDIVVLPPEESPPRVDPVDDAQVEAALARVDDTAARAWDTATRGLTDPPPAPDTTLTLAGARGTVAARARVATRHPDGIEVLTGLRAALQREGWDVGAPPTGTARLLGRLDDLLLRASYAVESEALIVELTSGPMLVGPARARALVGR